MIVVGIDVFTGEDAISFNQKNNGIYAAIGFHPQDTKKIDKDIWHKIKHLAMHDKVVAVGETGLDYFKEYTPKEIQITFFKKHIELSKELNLPLIIHNRDADEDCLKILREEGCKDVVFHCFASNIEFARKVWSAGYMTSFTGIITYPKANELRKVVEECPFEAMMIETDSPFLAPQKHRGKTNEPAYVVEIAQEISRIKDKPFSEIAEITTKNAETFFKL